MSPRFYEGIYHSNIINKPLAEVYAFCQRKTSLQEALLDLPEKTENFLDLEFVNSNANANGKDFQVQWQNNKRAEKQGRLLFNLSPSLKGKGTVLVANAIFNDFDMENAEPNDLINILLKRIKSLCETGEIATTNGQPNGNINQEINETHIH